MSSQVLLLKDLEGICHTIVTYWNDDVEMFANVCLIAIVSSQLSYPQSAPVELSLRLWDFICLHHDMHS